MAGVGGGVTEMTDMPLVAFLHGLADLPWPGATPGH